MSKNSGKEREYVRDAVVVPSGDTGAPWRHNVGAFILLVEQKARVMPDVMAYYQDSQIFARGNLGMAAINMQYQAMELGLGSCLIGMCDQSKMEQYFQIPHGDMVRMTLAIGYSDETGGPRKKIRKPFEEVCSFNKF